MTQYKQTEEELDAVVVEWLVDWKASVSAEEISNDEEDPTVYAPIYLVPMHGSDQDSHEESSRTPMDSEIEHIFEETKTKKRSEQGESRNIALMAGS